MPAFYRTSCAQQSFIKNPWEKLGVVADFVSPFRHPAIYSHQDVVPWFVRTSVIPRLDRTRTSSRDLIAGSLPITHLKCVRHAENDPAIKSRDDARKEKSATMPVKPTRNKLNP